MMTPHRLSSNGDVADGKANGMSNSGKTTGEADGEHAIFDDNNNNTRKLPPNGGSLPLLNGANNSLHHNRQTVESNHGINNPAKHDEWHDLGRFHVPKNGSHNVAAVERNSCMLEDLLATALEYDARIMAAAVAKEGGRSTNNEIGAQRPQHELQDVREQSSQEISDSTSVDVAANNFVQGGENTHRSTEPQDTPQDRFHAPSLASDYNEGGEIGSLLTPTLRAQIRKYVTQISNRYHHVGFHSFAHASHVMLSATKIVYLLQKQSPFRKSRKGDHTMDGQDDKVRDLTGTIYDPWLHFAISLSALLHDVDHKGVPNNQLSAESDPLAVKYGSEECMKSYAEWNSLDIGLTLLRDGEGYGEFSEVLGGIHAGGNDIRGGTDTARRCEEKKERFYEMVTDLVLCTDIASKERRELGMQKWARACCSHDDNPPKHRMRRRSSLSTIVTDNTSSNGSDDEMMDGLLLKLRTPGAAKAISEQIMQAADVSHTMQHFSTFAKWNSHLYHEVLAAYQCGRTPSPPPPGHPKESWYESQIGFFDHYIIPLAERLDACGAFSEEHKFAPLAVRNKEQWMEEGREFTDEMVKQAESMSLFPPMPVTPAATAMLDVSEKEGDLGDSSSVRRSDETTSSVSFARTSPASLKGTLNKAAESMAMWGSRASVTNLSRGDDVDSSVNALVPHLLVKQVVDSLAMDVHCLPPNMQMDALRGAVLRYQSAGSIQRHLGALLFVDISGFTHLSQNYPVEDFKAFINEYFTKIIDLVINFGGEVVKFAGDAVYAIWTTLGKASIDGSGLSGGITDSLPSLFSTGDALQGNTSHAINIEKCTACAIAINAECNNYRVSKSYNRRLSKISDLSNNSPDARGQGEVLYKMQDKNAKYEERGALLNVYCGVSEGVMAGVDVVASNRAEFFLVGKPLKDVAKAEQLAGLGELVASPSVYESLKKRENSMSIASKLVFTGMESGFQRVAWPNHPNVNDMLLYFKDGDSISNYKSDAQTLISELVQSTHSDEAPDPDSLQSDLMRLLEYHRHDAARDVMDQFTAELRRVVVLFISIMYEPALPDDPTEDHVILESFQSIYSIISESVSSRSGQVRQFINDDKGTVFIASFGARGSVILQPSDAAVDAAKEAQKNLLEIMGIQCSIGITLGDIFCGETGSYQRYEYSLLGPSVNLSARLMAKGQWGQINCDEELQRRTGRRHTFTMSGTHKLKGYDEPVPFYTPAQDEADKKSDEQDAIVTYFMQKSDVLGLVNDIVKKQTKDANSTTEIKPQIILIKGDEGRGKDAFMSGILKQPELWNSSVIMEANRCFHDDPFYCFIPIITRVLLSFSESRQRLASLKKRYKRSSVLASFLANDACQTQAFPLGTNIVPSQLVPYLSLVNDFVFKGFPLLKSSPEAKRLKDGEKVERCVEVLSALIIQYLKLREKPGVISIPEMDSMDSYSKKLACRILSSNANVLIIGGADDSAVPLEGESSTEDPDTFMASILGEGSNIDIEMVHLELLDKQSTFDLFRWSLRRDISPEDCEIIDQPEVRDCTSHQIFELCGGMTYATARLANTFCTQFQKDQHDDETKTIDFFAYLKTFLNDTPTDLEEIIFFRIDQLKPEKQMLLKIASVAGFDQYSFSQNLLETVLLAISRSEIAATSKDSDEVEDGEFQVPTCVGGDVPDSVGTSNENNFSYLFQGDYFERSLESLVAHKFLDEVNVEMSDLSSMDSVIYRFRNRHEQSVINGLMLNEQKKRTHFEVAAYYSSFHRGGGDSLGENDSTSLNTDITSVSATNWELLHVIALHYDLAEVPIPAMVNYYDSSASLSSLGVRDGAHGRLLSAYLMLEKILHHASTLDVIIDESVEQRRNIAGQMVRTIAGGEQLKDNIKMLTKDHLQLAFAGDIFAFKKSLAMVIKFGQSVGNMESQGYLLGSELYLQAILLMLLVLEDDAFANLTSSLGSFLEQPDITRMKERSKDEDISENSLFSSEGSCSQDSFNVDDLTVSFQAFSGLLTFYRDAPIGANQVQETFLANLFVAVTREANQMIHVLRTKCILSHLYLKHGNIMKALEECEEIKDIYDHDRYSLELVNIYGMDWCLICVATMASTYLFKGQFAAARNNIEFLKTQMLKLDEFASSTKAMSKGTISSFYLLLHEFENAGEIASGINATQYGYFFKTIGILLEELANRELSLNQHKAFDSSARDLDLLSILSSDGVHDENHHRPVLNQSAETLSDRGVEAVQAALCATEIRSLALQPNRNADTVKKQIKHCQAGLVYLKQSLGQNGANNHERRKNYLMCLYQQSDLLCWHHKLLHLLEDNFGDVQVEDILGIRGSEIDSARKSLDECRELSEIHDYPFMQLLAGKGYVKLGLDVSRGEDLIQRALEGMDPPDHEVAKTILSRIDDVQGVAGYTLKFFPPPASRRGVPSAA